VAFAALCRLDERAGALAGVHLWLSWAQAYAEKHQLLCGKMGNVHLAINQNANILLDPSTV